MEVGKRIVEVREKNGISRSALARKSGVSLSFINSIERGEKDPTVYTLRRLCSALGISLADFFAENTNDSTLPDNFKDLVTDLKNLRSSQLALVRNIIAEFSLTNQQLNKATTKSFNSEILDLFTSTTKPITLAGKPISLEERIQILETLRDILPPDENEPYEDDEVLVASYDGDQLFHIPTQEELEDIQKALEAAQEQKRKDQNENK